VQLLILVSWRIVEPWFLSSVGLRLPWRGTGFVFQRRSGLCICATGRLRLPGPIRDEIGLNYGIGALGPFSHANATIGRAYTLLSLNAGNCGKVGETYMGVIGNPANYANIVIAENEKESPWKPFSVRHGFKPDESVVSIFEGWGVISAKNSKYAVWSKDMNFAEELKNIFNDQPGRRQLRQGRGLRHGGKTDGLALQEPGRSHASFQKSKANQHPRHRLVQQSVLGLRRDAIRQKCLGRSMALRHGLA
jgi:hypothetical protein